MTLCGINNVYFDGTREDWVKMRMKLQALAKYDVDGRLKKYVEDMDVILRKFIDTYDGNPDQAWWNRIIGTREMREDSGIREGTYIDGWILHFFGIYRPTHIL